MPNWCRNSIIIPLEKKKDFIRKFTRQVKPKSAYGLKLRWFDFNRLVPMPIAEKDNWYDWRCENWGTKWNAFYTYFHEYKNGFGQDLKLFTKDEPVLEITFDTAWTPADDQIMRLIALRLGCHVEHTALEEGVGINFTCTYEHIDNNGDRYIEQDEFSGDYDEDEYRNILERFCGDSEYVQEAINGRFHPELCDDEEEDQAA